MHAAMGAFRRQPRQLECGHPAGPVRAWSIRTILGMSRDREAGGPAHGGPLPAHWPILPLALLAVALLAALLATQHAQPAWALALAVVLAAVGALLCGAFWSRQRQLDHLHDARLQNQLLGQLLDVWRWQTDAEHRLTRLSPPQGAPASAWVSGAFSGEMLWHRFNDGAQSLQARLQSQQPLGDLVV